MNFSDAVHVGRGFDNPARVDEGVFTVNSDARSQSGFNRPRACQSDFRRRSRRGAGKDQIAARRRAVGDTRQSRVEDRRNVRQAGRRTEIKTRQGVFFTVDNESRGSRRNAREVGVIDVFKRQRSRSRARGVRAGAQIARQRIDQNFVVFRCRSGFREKNPSR